jgi:tRNA G10  N-methylase Trm11
MVAELQHVNVRWTDVIVQRGNACDLSGISSDSIDAVVTHPPYIGSIPYAEYGVLSLKWLGEDPRELDGILTGGRRQSPDVVERFRADYSSTLQAIRRVLKPCRMAFVMVGNPVVRGEVVDLARMTCELAGNAGLQHVATALRKGMNRRANKMGAESLLLFEKE